MDAQQPPSSLDDAAVHALSNQLAVIVGFLEIILAATAAGDPRRRDLLEVQKAAVEASRIIGRPLGIEKPP